MTEQLEQIDRSPRYPGVDLETAISKAQELYNKIGKNKSYFTIALEHMGYTPKSGQGRIVMSSLEKFDLVEYVGRGDERKVALTDLALRIILDNRENSQEKKAAIKEAALRPVIYFQIWEEFNKTMPPEQDLRFYLLKDKEFTNTGADKFISQFKQTVVFAELDKDDRITPKEKTDTFQSRRRPQGQGIEDLVNILGNPFSNKEKLQNDPDPIQTKTMSEAPKTNDIQNISIPLSLKSAVTLSAKFPMSETEWNRMINMLEELKSELVASAPKTALPTNEDNNDNVE